VSPVACLRSLSSVQRGGAAGRVAGFLRGLDRGGLTGDGLVPRAIAEEQAGQACREGHHPGVLAGRGGLIQAREQAGAFGPQPRQSLFPVAQNRDSGRDSADR
jgi:hypothetical protein